VITFAKGSVEEDRSHLAKKGQMAHAACGAVDVQAFVLSSVTKSMTKESV
jgi:hypothetical protein